MISQEIVNEFFDELVAGVGDIPPERIFNFDETNFTDDPGMIPPWSYTMRSTSTKVG